MEQKPFKSQRAVEAEIRAYKLQRFEDYMVLADEGHLTRALAITAFSEELENPDAFWTPEAASADQ